MMVELYQDVERDYRINKSKSFEMLKLRWKLHLQPFFGQLKATQVTSETVSRYIDLRQQAGAANATVNRELATASTMDADATEFQAAGGSFWFKYSDWSEYGIELWSFYHRELKHEAARFYADYLPAGHYHLSRSHEKLCDRRWTSHADSWYTARRDPRKRELLRHGDDEKECGAKGDKNAGCRGQRS